MLVFVCSFALLRVLLSLVCCRSIYTGFAYSNGTMATSHLSLFVSTSTWPQRWQLPSSSVISAWTVHFILSYPAGLVYFLLPATKSSKPLVYYCFFSLLCSAQQTRLNIDQMASNSVKSSSAGSTRKKANKKKDSQCVSCLL